MGKSNKIKNSKNNKMDIENQVVYSNKSDEFSDVNNNDMKDGKEQKINSCRDIFWLFFYVVNALTFICFSLFAISRERKFDLMPRLNPSIISIFIISILVSIGFSMLQILLFKTYPKFSLYFAVVMYGLASAAALAIFFIYHVDRTTLGYTFFGVVAVLHVLFLLYILFQICRNVPMSSLFLKFAAKMILRNKATILFAICTNIICTALTILAVFGIIYIVSINDNIYYLYLVLYAISFIWTVKTIFYYQFTVAAEYAASVFLEKEHRGRKRLRDSIYKVTIYSLGSISLATLILTLVEVFVQVVKELMYEANSYIGCMCAYFLDLLEEILKLFSELVLVNIAIDGEKFTKSVKTTKKLLKGPNNAIISYVTTKILIFSYALAGSYICFFFAKIVLETLSEPNNVLICFSAMVIYLVSSYILLYLIHSIVLTLVVSYTRYRHLVEKNQPDFYEKFRKLTN